MLITESAVEDELRKICAAEPDRRNPVDVDNVCLYTTEDGTGHCIAGQVVLNLTGLAIPYEVNGYFPEVHKGSEGFQFPEEVEFENEAVFLLGNAQTTADGAESDDGTQVPRPWGLVAFELGLIKAPLNTVPWRTDAEDEEVDY